MRTGMFSMAALALALTAGCTRVDTSEVTVPQAERASIQAFEALRSGNVAKIDAIYDKGVVAVDPVRPEIVNDSAGMHKFNVDFAAMQFDRVDLSDRQIQLLGPLGFVLTGIVDARSTKGPVKAARFRITQVYRKQADGTFRVITEHASQMPSPSAPQP
ncbi:MAG: YybH family protein [Novosphingobium sp.]